MLCGQGLGATHIHRPLTTYVLGAKINTFSDICKFFHSFLLISKTFRTSDLSQRHSRSTIKTKKCIFVLYSPHLFVPLHLITDNRPQWRVSVTSKEIINKRLLLFGTLQNLPHSRRNKNRRISRKCLCVKHGRDLSGFWGLW